MLDLPSVYTTALSSPFQENWIVKLYSDNTNYIGISFDSITIDSVSYTGAILNSPSLRESISIESGKASVGNISLEVAEYMVGSNKFSKEIFTGGYINNTVKIYSVLNSNTNINNALQLFSGVLSSMTSDENGKLKLTIITTRPWDGIEIPNQLSDSGVYVPVAYGDYVNNNASSSSQFKLYPSPFINSESNYLNFATHDSIGAVYGSYYDSSAKVFPSLSMQASVSQTKDGVDAIQVLNSITRTYRIKPNLNANDSSDYTDPLKAMNDSVSDYATASISADNDTVTKNLKIDLPNLSGKVTSILMYIKYDYIYDQANESGITSEVALRYIHKYGETTSAVNIFSDTSIDSNEVTYSSSGSADIDNSGTSHTSLSMTSIISANSNKLPDEIWIQNYVSNSHENPSNSETTSEAKIYDIWFQITVAEDTDNEPSSAGKEVASLDTVYIGTDGFSKSWSSGTAKTTHDVHRDILYRLLGITASPRVNNTTLWSTIDNEKNCEVRFFTEPNKPNSILNYLETLAYEGGFTFRFRATGEPVYNFIPNSPSTDLTLTHSDIIDLKITHTPLTQLTTNWTVQYNKSPAGSVYNSKSTHTMSERYNYTGVENKKDIKLKYTVSDVSRTGTNRNDSFLDYYTDVLGEIKQMVSFNLVNPTKLKLEVGDFISFSSMEIDSMDGTWSNKYIVTSTSRGVGGKMSITAREI